MSYSFSNRAGGSAPCDEDEDEDEDEENTIKILVATDCHIGYSEKDGIRHSDSINSFEEILQQAKNNKVDMLLLGGDLFHDNKPSRKSLHGCMTLIRKYCMGDRPVQIQMLSDQSLNFAASPFPLVNYEDPNINVEIPVFSIHGNHDDPTGLGNLCALDILSVSGLVNYFGKCNSLDSIDVTPLLIQKGTTKLSLYGIGSIRDERMHRIFVSEKIKFFRDQDENNPWFNLLVLHQNRVKHGETNYIPEQFLPDFLDLVIWGHEHECRITPEWNDRQHFYISQPGSSIATSLSQSESVQKHICILRVRGKAVKCTKIRLETVRPFYMKDIDLQHSGIDPDHPKVQEKVEAFCSEKVEALIGRAEDEHTGNPKQPTLPLIRIRVDYSGGFETFNISRFGQKFVHRVANTRNIVLFHRRNVHGKKGIAPGEDMGNYLRPEALDSGRVEDLVQKYFANAGERDQLNLLSEKGLGQAVQEFVDKEERDAIKHLVDFQLEKTQKHLKKRKTEELLILQELKLFKQECNKLSSGEESKEMEVASQKAKEKRREQGTESPSNSDDDDDKMSVDSDDASVPPTSRGGRGPGGARGRGQVRGKGSTSGARGARGGKKVPAARGKQSVISGSFLEAPKPSTQYPTYELSSGSDDSLSNVSRPSNPPRKSRQHPVQYIESDESDDFDQAPPTKKEKKS